MPEVQSFGFVFEKWIRDTFFDGYETNYSAKWDISKESNTKHGNLPISIKTTKYSSSINLGDAIRQISIDEDFILINGYWIQEGNYKRIVNVTADAISVMLWKSLWKPLTIDDIKKLDSLIKTYDKHYTKIRKQAKKLKKSAPYSNCSITLNPKIDSKTQRRLQCSINFKLHFDKIAVKSSREIQESPKLWGEKVPNPWLSGSRKFNKRKR